MKLKSSEMGNQETSKLTLKRNERIEGKNEKPEKHENWLSQSVHLKLDTENIMIKLEIIELNLIRSKFEVYYNIDKKVENPKY